MLIRSQDKETIVNLQSIGQIYTAGKGIKSKLYVDFPDGRTALLGIYGDTMSILDDLQDQYQYVEECKYFGCGAARPEFVFQMPTEGEQ